MQHSAFVIRDHLWIILMLVSHFLFSFFFFLLQTEYNLHVKLKLSDFKLATFCRNHPRLTPAACRCWSVQQQWWDAQCCVLISEVSVMLEKNHCLSKSHSQPGSLGLCACKVDRQVICAWSQLERMWLNLTKDRCSTKGGKMATKFPHTNLLLTWYIWVWTKLYISIAMMAKPIKVAVRG